MKDIRLPKMDLRGFRQGKNRLVISPFSSLMRGDLFFSLGRFRFVLLDVEFESKD